MKKLLYAFTALFTTIAMAQSTTISAAPATAEAGETITISISFDTGSADLATNAYYELRDVTEDPVQWKAGQNLALDTPVAVGTHTTTTFTIPATVDPTHDFLLIANYKIGGAFGMGTSQAIDITPAPVAESWSFGEDLTFNAGTTLDVPIKYSSDEDIAAGGIKFIIWTETRGTVSEVNLFSDIWYGAFTNPSILPAGTNVETTITITAPNGMINPSTSKTYLSSDLTTWDPNAGDAGNNYVDHATTPAPTYTFQFRTALGTDASFQVKPASADFTVTESLSSADFKKLDAGLSPNPTTGIINIADTTGIKSISILTITGQVVKTFEVQSSIDISSLSSGVYILITDNGMYQKIIKE
ncbi:hypothetical protein FHR24_002740 [Wenyingzhuangia heitensis]|uniref:Secretion system C-terminal sorting domain-containing protein n=1 Tax=Wenyingzhuangia heitensis TaxID=1487859 RepID=A0ABX0UFR4_9FLAO|nr:T9SS type A sorting domain-containing protein [Wenyingzhuangia heitensis]NIJ46256.1 hypothetical protein [Wenyingzhuangia heitensis]